MSYFSTEHFRLTFSEANILAVNAEKLNHPDLIRRLQDLIENTTDENLKDTTTSLFQKIVNLSAEEYQQLKQDIGLGKVSYPPNYMLK